MSYKTITMTHNLPQLMPLPLELLGFNLRNSLYFVATTIHLITQHTRTHTLSTLGTFSLSIDCTIKVDVHFFTAMYMN